MTGRNEEHRDHDGQEESGRGVQRISRLYRLRSYVRRFLRVRADQRRIEKGPLSTVRPQRFADPFRTGGMGEHYPAFGRMLREILPRIRRSDRIRQIHGGKIVDHGYYGRRQILARHHGRRPSFIADSYELTNGDMTTCVECGKEYVKTHFTNTCSPKCYYAHRKLTGLVKSESLKRRRLEKKSLPKNVKR